MSEEKGRKKRSRAQGNADEAPNDDKLKQQKKRDPGSSKLMDDRATSEFPDGLESSELGVDTTPIAFQEDIPDNKSHKRKSVPVNRGYVAYFNWKNHFNNEHGLKGPRPVKTELVPSIPAMFHRVISTLQEVEKENAGRDILTMLDRKLLRPTGAAVAPGDRKAGANEKKLTLYSASGTEYVINACRKEHVRLLYDGSISLFSRLGICPQLVDVFAVAGGREHCVGGPSMHNSGIQCSCSGKLTPRTADGTPASRGFQSFSGAPPVIQTLHGYLSSKQAHSNGNGSLSHSPSPSPLNLPNSSPSSSPIHPSVAGTGGNTVNGKRKTPSPTFPPSSLRHSPRLSTSNAQRSTTPTVNASISPSPSLTQQRINGANHSPYRPLSASTLFPVGTATTFHEQTDAQKELKKSSHSVTHNADFLPDEDESLQAADEPQETMDETDTSNLPNQHLSFHWNDLSGKVSDTRKQVDDYYKRRYLAQEQKLQELTERVKNSDDQIREWEQRWKAEKDQNTKLWDRIEAIKEQLKNMTSSARNLT